MKECHDEQRCTSCMEVASAELDARAQWIYQHAFVKLELDARAQWIYQHAFVKLECFDPRWW